MAEFKKPSSLGTIWASQGDKVRPTDEKMAMGWQVEVPHREHFNWFWNKLDTFLAHTNQRGIPEWDALTEYLEDKSLVQGSDGKVYRCKFTNRGNNPTTSPDHWEVAFISSGDSESMKLVLGYTTSVGDVNALVNKKYYFTNPARLTLPAIASRGDVITVSKSPNISIEIGVDSGEPIYTINGLYETIIFDVFDEVNFINNGVNWEVV